MILFVLMVLVLLATLFLIFEKTHLPCQRLANVLNFPQVSGDEYEMTFAQNKDSKSSVPLLVVSSIQAPNTSHSVNGSVPTYIMSIDPLIKSNQLKVVILLFHKHTLL